MKEITKITGRLGNQMSQWAFIHAYSKRNNIQYYPDDPEYFEEFKEEIREMYGEGVRLVNLVSIHVRRKDYVGNNFYIDLSETDYYQRAMDEFPEENFIVFSDDIEWCKTNKLFKNCDFSVGRTEIEDMNLMAGCKAHIIANSSFSWWAAYIGGGKVVCPKKWFTNGMKPKLLKEWKQI